MTARIPKPTSSGQDEKLTIIKGLRCPACNREALFVGSGGYVTCGNLECPNPDYEAAIAQHTKEAVERELQELANHYYHHEPDLDKAREALAVGLFNRLAELAAPQQSKERSA